MESAVLGLVLDSSVLIAAERIKLATPEVIKRIRGVTGDIRVVSCSLTVAELGHGIYRADTAQRSQQRRQFLDELKSQVPILPITESTAEIIVWIDGAHAAKGIKIPLADLIIELVRLN